jgi:hypothetical protein
MSVALQVQSVGALHEKMSNGLGGGFKYDISGSRQRRNTVPELGLRPAQMCTGTQRPKFSAQLGARRAYPQLLGPLRHDYLLMNLPCMPSGVSNSFCVSVSVGWAIDIIG